MEIKLLRYFYEAARNGSFTLAANHLAITQSALSQGVALLERQLNCQLFIRGRKIILSPEGEKLLQHCERLFCFLEDIHEDLNQTKDGHCGTIRIGVLESVLLFVFPKVIAEFSESFPKIQFTFEKADTLDIEKSIVDGLWHFGVISRQAHSDKLLQSTLGAVPHALWAPASNKKTAKSLFGDYPLFVLGEWQVKMIKRKTSIFKDYSKVRVASPVNCIGVLRQLVSAGLGLAVLPEYVSGPDIRMVCRFENWPMKLFLIRRKHGYMSTPAHRFHLLLLEKFSSLGFHCQN